MKVSRTTAWAVSISLILTPVLASAADKPVSFTKAERTSYQTRVFAYGPCEYGKPADTGREILPFLLAPLVATFASAGIKLFGSFIGKLGEEKKITTATRESVGFSSYDTDKEVPTINGKFSCLAVVRGTFGEPVIPPKDYPDEIEWAWKSADPIWRKSTETALSADSKIQRLRKMKLTAPPDLFLELAVVPAVDNSAFQLIPVFLAVAQNQGGGGSRHLNFGFSFSVPGAADAKTTFGVSTISLPPTKAPYVLKAPALGGLTSGWMPMPPVTTQSQALIDAYKAAKKADDDANAAKKTLEDANKPLSATEQDIKKANDRRVELQRANTKETERWKLEMADKAADITKLQAKLANEKLAAKTGKTATDKTAAEDNLAVLNPVNIDVVIDEIRPANEFLKAVATALGGSVTSNADALQTALVNTILPAVRDSATATTAATDQLAAYNALKAYQDKLNTLAGKTGGDAKAAYYDAYAAYVDLKNKIDVARHAGATVLPDLPAAPVLVE